MSPALILSCVIAYSALLFYVVWKSSRNADNESYFIGNKSSKWYLVAYGMIGASLSGVTFMSVPGLVGSTSFSYMVLVFGYFFGYAIIALVLLPLYYKMNLTSIYTYLERRFGFWSYKTGAFFFIVSRTIGAAFRLYIVVNVLQLFIFDAWGVPFWVTVLAFILLILLYTYEGGVKTIVLTDTLQTTFMLLAIVISVFYISNELDMGIFDLFSAIHEKGYDKMFNMDWHSKSYFLKQFLGGMFIAVAMTGLDQEMMQKNISVRTLGDSQKNIFSFSIVLVFINLLFLCLGALLFLYSTAKGIPLPEKSDDLFPIIALNHLGGLVGIVFIIGLISAAYPSADGALTALTSSFCIDFLNFKKSVWTEEHKKKIRYIVHFSFAALLLLVIIIFRAINDDAVISKLFTVASYTYGPLLGLFAYGILAKREIRDKFVPVICLLSPAICYVLNENSVQWFSNYKFGFELLIVNGLITYGGLWVISKKSVIEHLR
ncbi:MAG: sodium:solute symporter [Bacteroidota bacterium]